MAQNPLFKFVHKDRLFYGRFEYSIGFHLPEGNCLRELSHESIDINIERRREWQEVAQQRVAKSAKVFTNVILTRRTREITDQMVEDLHELADILLTSNIDYKLVVSVDQVWVYTNNLELLKTIDDLKFLIKKTYTRAIIIRPRDTVQLKNPQHQLRSFLRSVKLTKQQKDQLTAFLVGQSDWIRIGPALNGWLLTPFLRTQDYFFVDYDSESWATMLSLVHPGLIRKTLSIIPYK